MVVCKTRCYVCFYLRIYPGKVVYYSDSHLPPIFLFFFRLLGFSWLGGKTFLSLWQVWHWADCWWCCHGMCTTSYFKVTPHPLPLVMYRQSEKRYFISGKLLLTTTGSCRIRSSRSSRESSASSSTTCWSLLKIWAQSRNYPLIQGSWKATTP